MTQEQFEEYLISIGGLINGWYTDREPITSRGFFSVNDGWLQLVHDLIGELIQIGWDKHILQVKEKFSTLRFYIASGNNEMYDIISKYEAASSKICEVCGNAGEMTKVGGWYTTLCENHKE